MQSDLFTPSHDSVTLCPITSTTLDAPLFRVTLPPGDRTGLATASQVMVDKVLTVPRTAIVRQIGSCDSMYLDAIDDALRVWLSL